MEAHALNKSGYHKDCYSPNTVTRDWQEYVKSDRNTDWLKKEEQTKMLSRRATRIEWQLDTEVWIGYAGMSLVEYEFNKLSEKWEDETGAMSLSDQKINDTYLKIIALGPDVIPYMLKAMNGPYGSPFWHTALRILTDENPVQSYELTKPNLIRQRWVDWGKSKKII
jgi:hypothetical protein